MILNNIDTKKIQKFKLIHLNNILQVLLSILLRRANKI